jgi:uncharacterized protein
MKLHEQRQGRMNLIGRYAAGEIRINEHRMGAPCIVAPGFLLQEWIAGIGDLDAGSLAPVWALQARIVLLGSASLPPERMKPVRGVFAARQIALEAMDLGAACRTYNVLAQEDRAVAALLFP